MSLETEMAELADTLHQLRAADTRFRVFGSPSHRYALHPVLSEAELREFEATHGVRLPEDYRLFLRTIAGGGAGPYYGLETLETAAKHIKPGNPFPFVSPDPDAPPAEAAGWRRSERSGTLYLADEPVDEWYDAAQPGVLEICHQGCAIYSHLVVNGPEHGRIWEGNGDGFYPADETFREWYAGWMDRVLRLLRSEALVQDRLRIGMTKAEVADAIDAPWKERTSAYEPRPVSYFEASGIPAQLILDEGGRVIEINPWLHL